MTPILKLFRPKQPEPAPAEPLPEFHPYDGHLDTAQGGILHGWACNNVDPSAPVKVQFYLDGALIGEAEANAYREDLRLAGIGLRHGKYAFCFYVPAEVRDLRKYSIAAFADGVHELKGSPAAIYEPRAFEFRTPGPHARDFLAHQYLHGSGIEIGALDKPTTVPEGTVVRYVDSRDSETLQDYYRTELHGHAVVPVDLVADAHTLEGVDNGSQDFVIANQVLEHLENPLLAVENMLRVLKPGGIAFLSLPDKRYTFDINRPVTRFSHVVTDYRGGPEISRESHYLEWIEHVEKVPLAEIPARLYFILNVLRYPIHFHVWTPFEILEMFDQARAVLPFPYELDCFKANESEMLVVLRRN